MRVLLYPPVIFGSCFGDDLLVSTDSVFIDFFWVNHGRQLFRIRASQLKGVSIMISESTTKFSLTISQLTGTVGADESTFRWGFSSRHWLHFRLLFLSQQGPRELLNPRITFGRYFADDFQSASTSFSLNFSESTGDASESKSMRHLWKVFRWWFFCQHRLRFRWLFLSQKGLATLPNPRVTFESCFGDDFWVDNNLVFVDYFWVNMSCGRCRIHASPLEVVLLTFS